MSTPDFEVHRAIVHYSNPSTGAAQVRIPSLLGIDQVVNIPTIGLTNTDGFWNVPSIGSSVFVAVADDRTQFLWLTAVGISGSGGDDPSNEPIGHEDRTASYIAFDNGTRTFSIQPANGSYVVWCVGLRYEKSTTESVVLPDTTGLYYIYFDPQGVLQYRDSYFVWDQDCPTSYVYWNSATQRAEFFSDERHGITMDWQTHEYLHRTRGAAYANGFDASNFDTSTKNGNTDAQAKLDIDNGTFFDEDLQVDIRHSLAPAANTWEQQLQGPARIPVFYRSGTGYVYDAPTDFPVKQGVTHPVYNSSSGGNWSTTELGANTYGIQWIVATNQLNYPVLSIMGQAQYANVGQAEAASWASMDLSGLPVVEIRILYKIIFRATGSNTPGCYFDQIDDYRNALSNATSTAAAVVDHGNLTGLGDDDHPQYLNETRGDARYYTETEIDALFVPAGSDGQIQYNNGGAFGGASQLYYDDVNSRVGIGTASPGAELEVARSADGRDTTHINGQLRLQGADPTRLTIESSNSSNLWNIDNSNGDLRIFRENWAASGTGAGGAVRVWIQDDGDVSIGPAAPSYKLDVGGDIRSTGTVHLDTVASQDDNTYKIEFDPTGGVVRHTVGGNSAIEVQDFVSYGNVYFPGSTNMEEIFCYNTLRVDYGSTPQLIVDGNSFLDNVFMFDRYAFVEGPTSGSSTLQFTGTTYTSNSTYFSVSASGITINRQGRYWVTGGFRANGTGDVYAYLGVSGNRATLEGRSDSGWTHDHASYASQHTHSAYVGILGAGWTVTLGTSNTGRIQYGSQGYSGYIFIHYIGE